MRSLRRPLLRDTIDFLKSNGAQDSKPSHGGKHLKVRFRFASQNLVSTVSVSPSDWRVGRQQRTQLKRILREATARAAMRTVNHG